MKKALLVLVVFSLLSFGAVVHAETIIKPETMVVAAWVPNWTKEVGINTAKDHITFFNELSPFGYEINYKGKIKDGLAKDKKYWQALFAVAKKNNVKIIPTILWTSSEGMEKFLGNIFSRESQIRDIVSLVEKNNYAGIDIDYEGKDVSLKNNFSDFIKSLAISLHVREKVLSCTIEARAQDDIPGGWDSKKAMSWANDLSVLNKYCDQIRVMTYDEQSQAIGKTWLASSTSPYYAPNASKEWVERVITYMTRYISPNKFMLGIPTYGWQYTLTPEGNDVRYKFYKSMSYTNAVLLNATRDKSGELGYTYLNSKAKNIFVSLPDAVTIQQGFDIARKYSLRGVAIFKIDGKEDLRMWGVH
ncbi:MAG: hypothetical protein EXS50_01695 [Candidatus Taylorbacteria bacterium]|nr:hypothetical protein [Candidatus Taylorbacteria bacterium]